MKLFQNAKYQFIEQRRSAYVFSGVFLLAGVVAMGMNIGTLGSWQNYGVDFLGGSLIQVRFEAPITDEQIREALTGAGAPEVTRFGQENEFVIRAPVAEEGSISDVADEVEAQLRAGLTGRAFEVVRTEAVGAKVGFELQRQLDELAEQRPGKGRHLLLEELRRE